MSLVNQAFSGFKYVFLSSIISKAIILGGGIILARILTPEDFGLLAMLYIIFEVSSFLMTAGFGLVLIREKSITEEDLSTVFWFNLLVSIILVLLVWILGQRIVDFYNEPRLLWLSRLMSLNLIFSAFGIVQKSIFQRNLFFKKLSIVEVLSSVISIIVAIILAYNNFGYYALGVKYILTSLLATIMLYAFNPWKPKYFIRKKSFAKLFAFGGNVMLLGLVNTVSRNAHQIVIGKFFSVSSLGFFNQGNMLKDNIVNTVSTSISQVIFPILSKIQEDKLKLKNAYSRILAVSSFVIFPLVTIFFFIAKPLIIFLLGVKWEGTVIFFKILLIGAALNHIHKINLNVLKVCGKGSDYLMQGIFRNGITLTAVFIGLKYGAVGIAIGLVISEFIQLGINAYYSNKHIKFNLVEQFNVMVPIISLNTFLVLFTVFCNHFFNFYSFYFLFIYPLIYLMLYILLSKLFKLTSLREITQILYSRFPKLFL